MLSSITNLFLLSDRQQTAVKTSLLDLDNFNTTKIKFIFPYLARQAFAYLKIQQRNIFFHNLIKLYFTAHRFPIFYNELKFHQISFNFSHGTCFVVYSKLCILPFCIMFGCFSVSCPLNFSYPFYNKAAKLSDETSPECY